jgi:uncharacterized C2H2 Zn-finger protein
MTQQPQENRCPECGAEFPTREELERHAKQAHGKG